MLTYLYEWFLQLLLFTLSVLTMCTVCALNGNASV